MTMAGTSDPRVGTDLGPYHIEAVVGRGGMGVVYLAEQPSLGRKVALKILPPELAADTAFRARFGRESRMAAAIDDPNILPIYEAGEIEGVLFIAMRYVEGSDLEQRLTGGALPPRQVVHLLGQVASALDAAHARGLVHRDVKPGNILIAAGHDDVRGEHVYLADFGLTKSRGVDTSLTRAGSLMGTLDYMAPEQLEGRDLDGAADQYALAAIAFRALTGQLPFTRDSEVALITAHLKDPPPSVSTLVADLPAAVDGVIARGMAKAPADRYPSSGAFMADLGSAVGVSATPSLAAVPRPRPRIEDPRIWLAVVAVAALIVAGGLIGSGSRPGAAGVAPSASAERAATSPTALATADVSTSDGPFPDPAEAALLGLLPGSLAATCTRGTYVEVPSDISNAGPGGAIGSPPFRKPVASLSCRQAAISGANLVLIRDFGEARNTGQTGFTTEGAISSVAGRQGTGEGDCSTTTRVSGRWQRAGADAGAIVCFTDSSSGDAILYWSYKDDAILVKAVNEHGDAGALYDYFQTTGVFIAHDDSAS